MNLNRKQSLVLFGSVILITSLLTSITVLAAIPSNTFVISSGVYPYGAAYTIYPVSGTFYAKNQNGIIEYSDTDAAAVTQYCIDTLAALPGYASGKIKFTAGNFTFAYTVNLTWGIQIAGEGYNTQIICTGDGFTSYQKSRIKLENFYLIGDAGTNDFGINFTETYSQVYFENIMIEYFDVGIYLDTCNSIVISDSAANYCNYASFWASEGEAHKLTGCSFYGSGSGMILEYTPGLVVTECVIQACIVRGAYIKTLAGVYYNFGVQLKDNTWEGNVLDIADDGVGTVISGNTFINYPGTASYAIYAQDNASSITFNHFRNYTYAVNIPASGLNTFITGNYIDDDTANLYVDAGTGTLSENNRNSTSWID